LECFHHNSKFTRHFQVKPKPFESKQNYLKLSCLHQRPIQNGKGRKIVKYEESDSPKSCHDFRNRGAFLCPEITKLSANKNRGMVLTASGPEISFSKVRFPPFFTQKPKFHLPKSQI